MRSNLWKLSALGGLLLLASGVPLAAQEALKVDKDAKSIFIPAKVALRKLPDLAEIYPLEVICTFAKGEKKHETIVTSEVKPSEIHKALESLGLKPGKPAKGEDAKAEGPETEIYLEVPKASAPAERIGIEKLMVDRKTGKAMPKLKWLFTGSAMKQPDPDKPEKVYGADFTGTHIAIFPVTEDTVLQTNLTMKEEKLIKLETNKKLLPAEGSPVTLVIVVK